MAADTSSTAASPPSCCAAEQQYTANRRAVTAVLAAADGPMTLPEILGADRSLAQSSAYRSLAVLVDAGVVRRLVHGGDHAHYELAEHLTEHHHHLVCDACGTVVDVTLPDAGRDRDGPLVRRRRRPSTGSPPRATRSTSTASAPTAADGCHTGSVP